MEKMASDVQAAIDGTMFDKEAIRCFCGIGDQLVFVNDEGLKYVTSLCDDQKESCDLHYSAVERYLQISDSELGGHRKLLRQLR